jgi:hypothetical protein
MRFYGDPIDNWMYGIMLVAVTALVVCLVWMLVTS